MSSPLAKKRGGWWGGLLVWFHRRASHGRRVGILAKRIADVLREVAPDIASLLDVGCGDMTLAETIQTLTSIRQVTCTDIYPRPDTTEERWAKYVPFDGKTLPFADREFDAVLLVDVLHHAEDQLDPLLREAARVSKLIVIKDHFEFGLYSQTLLKAMDIVGNWGYGVSIPKRYFNPARFEQLISRHRLRELRRIPEIQLYGHLPLVKWILRPRWQFISVLQSSPGASS